MFAQLCARIGVTFIGPSPEAMRRLSDKVRAKLAAEATNAVADGVIDRPIFSFAPGFDAGAVAGYCLMRIDPAIVATVSADPVASTTLESIPDREDVPHASGDIAVAFGA